MVPRPRVLGLIALAFLACPLYAEAAPPVRVIASDDRGLTLRLDVAGWRLEPAGTPGTQRLVLAELDGTSVPGRPALPFASVLVALPPGARAVARVDQSGPWEEVGRATLEVAGRPGFEGTDPRDLVPVRTPVEAIPDGPWPRSPVEAGEPFSLRRQRMAAVQLLPFRWDATSGVITVTRSLTVRVDFVGAAPPAPGLGAVEEDRHWEPVLRSALLNYEQARAWRGRPARSQRRATSSLLSPGLAGAAGRAAFDESNPEVRVQLDTSGVYELSYTELAAKGYPAGIPIGQVSVHRHEFVEGATPPYVTIEMPIEVDDGDGDGFFTDADRIVLWAQSWANRSRASWAQRAWGDGEVVYATVAPGGGLRMPTRPGWRNVAGLTPLASYPFKQRTERNFNYFLFPPDTLTDQFHWTEISLYYDRADTLRFATNHLDTTHTVTVTASWVGRRQSSTHVAFAQYRKQGGPFITVADSSNAIWSGVAPLTVTAFYPGSTLGEGNVNTMRVWGRGPGLPDPSTNNSDNVGFNYVETTYWRRFRALNGILSCNSAGAQGEIQILADGYSNGFGYLRAYDVTDSLNPVALQIDESHVSLVNGAFQVELQDSVPAGQVRQYVVFTAPKVLPAERYSAVTRRQLTNRGAADYLLVVPEAFEAAVAPLAALRQSQGLNVLVAPLEAVNDEFGGGRHWDYAIKRLVRYAYDNWNAKFLLLVGDGSEDPQNFMAESSPDLIPVHKISGPVFIQFGYEIIPSDPWYVCMENCNLGSSEPVLQDLFVGRLPVQTVQQTQDVVAKLVAYENLAGDQTWRRRILLCDDDAYSAETFFGGGGTQLGYCYRPGEVVFRLLNETIANLIRNGAGLQQAVLDTFHLDTRLAGVACANADCSCRTQSTTQQITHGSVTPDLLSRLQDGRMWWNYQGHANEFVLAHEDLYVNRGIEDDKDLLQNDGKPFLFSAFSCHANAFARFADRASGRGPALGEEMTTLPVRGAIASWASTGYEILPFSGSSHVNVSWARSMFQDPPHDEYLGDKGARVVLGETIALGLVRFVPTAFSSERGVGLTYHLLGDPGTRLSIGPPQAMVTANALPVTSGQAVRLHTVGDTLRLEADLVSNVAITSIALDRTDPSGTAEIPATDYALTPTFPDTGAAGSGGRRYHLSYFSTLRPESYQYTFRTQDRYGVPGSFDVVFQFLTNLLLDNVVLNDDDPVPPAGNLTLRVVSPRPVDPSTDLTLTVNGVSQPFTFAADPGDASGREWTLAWNHPPYPIDRYVVRLAVQGGGTHEHAFRVTVGGSELRLENPIAFPNPFDDERGTSFSFQIVSGSAADLQIRIFTTRGRLLYERVERDLSPGYHQLPWDGRDAEGDKLANGVYVYRMLATNGSSKAEHVGRLVKLRKPRRAEGP